MSAHQVKTVEIDRSGKVYVGEWYEECGLVTVVFESVPPQTTQVGASSIGTARMLLSEMVDANMRQPI